jgi:hypothetical protein
MDLDGVVMRSGIPRHSRPLRLQAQTTHQNQNQEPYPYRFGEPEALSQSRLTDRIRAIDQLKNVR